MPNPNQYFLNNSHSPPSIPKTLTSSSRSSGHNTHSHTSSRKSLSNPQLFATYNEIINEWCNEQWLTFADGHTNTYLTLDPNVSESLTIQMAINQYDLLTGQTLIDYQPECLLIRTKSKSKTSFIPDSTISLERLLNNRIHERIFQYKLMAIVCHSKETNSKLMFYKDFQSNSWYIYYDQSKILPSHSNILSNDEQYQLELFIQGKNYNDLFKFSAPLSALCSNPIIYVYIPEKIM